MTAGAVRIHRRDAVLAALEAFRRIYPQISLTSVRIFLYVADNPGINVSELARACGLTDAGASRVARALAGRGIERPLPPSLGLLDSTTSPLDPRERLLGLTERGRALVAHVELLIAAHTPIVLPCEPIVRAGPDAARSTQSHREAP